MANQEITKQNLGSLANVKPVEFERHNSDEPGAPQSLLLSFKNTLSKDNAIHANNARHATDAVNAANGNSNNASNPNAHGSAPFLSSKQWLGALHKQTEAKIEKDITPLGCKEQKLNFENSLTLPEFQALKNATFKQFSSIDNSGLFVKHKLFLCAREGRFLGQIMALAIENDNIKVVQQLLSFMPLSIWEQDFALEQGCLPLVKAVRRDCDHTIILALSQAGACTKASYAPDHDVTPMVNKILQDSITHRSQTSNQHSQPHHQQPLKNHQPQSPQDNYDPLSSLTRINSEELVGYKFEPDLSMDPQDNESDQEASTPGSNTLDCTPRTSVSSTQSNISNSVKMI